MLQLARYGDSASAVPMDKFAAVRILKLAYELGVRLVDTAWYYGPDICNDFIAEAFHPYPSDLLVVSKLGNSHDPTKGWASALSDSELRSGCERDLRHLRLEALPMVLMRWNQASHVPFDEALGSIVRMQQEGKVREIGLSNVGIDEVRAAAHLVRVAAVSNAYNVLNRADEEMIDFCEDLGIPYLAYYPLAGGTVRLDRTLVAAAGEQGISAAQAALAWTLRRSPIICPIPGTTDLDHLSENVEAGRLTLADAAFQSLSMLAPANRVPRSAAER